MGSTASSCTQGKCQDSHTTKNTHDAYPLTSSTYDDHSCRNVTVKTAILEKLGYSSTIWLEYCLFVSLHKGLDLTTTYLSPPAQIENVWLSHLQHTKDYHDFCSQVANQYVHHDPTKAFDNDTMWPGRFTHTCDLYRKVYQQEPPKDIWFSPSDMSTPGEMHEIKAPEKQNGCGKPIRVFIKETTGSVTPIDIGSDCLVSMLKASITEHMHIPGKDVRLLFNCVNLQDQISLSDYGIGHEMTLHLVQRMRGC